jgi:hypothetical protein
VLGYADLALNPATYVTAPRPPMLRDYFDPKLRKMMRVSRTRRHIKLSFAVEAIDVHG